MPHNITIKIIDSCLHLRREIADLPAAVSAALLALEERQPGTLEHTTPAVTLDEALAAVGPRGQHNGHADGSIWTVPHSARNRLTALQLERNEP